MADLSLELHELVLALDREAEARLRPLGLTYRKFVALFVIGEHPGVAARDLAGALSITEAAVSQLLPGLVGAGWVEVVHAPGSGRRRPLRLTDAGAGLLADAGRRLGRSLDAHVRGLGLDPDALAHTLSTIRSSL